jgi:predicted ArsR family transcriptional regulator
MSRGVGATQRDILALLPRDAAIEVSAIADKLELGIRQVRRAVRSLEGRGLVVVLKRSAVPVAGGGFRYYTGKGSQLWVFDRHSYARWSSARNAQG